MKQMSRLSIYTGFLIGPMILLTLFVGLVASVDGLNPTEGTAWDIVVKVNMEWLTSKIVFYGTILFLLESMYAYFINMLRPLKDVRVGNIVWDKNIGSIIVTDNNIDRIRRNNNGDYKPLSIHEDSCFITWSKPGGVYVELSEVTDQYDHIKYVHEAQNAYEDKHGHRLIAEIEFGL